MSAILGKIIMKNLAAKCFTKIAWWILVPKEITQIKDVVLVLFPLVNKIYWREFISLMARSYWLEIFLLWGYLFK